MHTQSMPINILGCLGNLSLITFLMIEGPYLFYFPGDQEIQRWVETCMYSASIKLESLFWDFTVHCHHKYFELLHVVPFYYGILLFCTIYNGITLPQCFISSIFLSNSSSLAP